MKEENVSHGTGIIHTIHKNTDQSISSTTVQEVAFWNVEQNIQWQCVAVCPIIFQDFPTHHPVMLLDFSVWQLFQVNCI